MKVTLPSTPKVESNNALNSQNQRVMKEQQHEPVEFSVVPDDGQEIICEHCKQTIYWKWNRWNHNKLCENWKEPADPAPPQKVIAIIQKKPKKVTFSTGQNVPAPWLSKYGKINYDDQEQFSVEQKNLREIKDTVDRLRKDGLDAVAIQKHFQKTDKKIVAISKQDLPDQYKIIVQQVLQRATNDLATKARLMNHLDLFKKKFAHNIHTFGAVRDEFFLNWHLDEDERWDTNQTLTDKEQYFRLGITYLAIFAGVKAKTNKETSLEQRQQIIKEVTNDPGIINKDVGLDIFNEQSTIAEWEWFLKKEAITVKHNKRIALSYGSNIFFAIKELYQKAHDNFWVESDYLLKNKIKFIITPFKERVPNEITVQIYEFEGTYRGVRGPHIPIEEVLRTKAYIILLMEAGMYYKDLLRKHTGQIQWHIKPNKFGTLMLQRVRSKTKEGAVQPVSKWFQWAHDYLKDELDGKKKLLKPRKLQDRIEGYIRNVCKTKLSQPGRRFRNSFAQAWSIQTDENGKMILQNQQEMILMGHKIKSFSREAYIETCMDHLGNIQPRSIYDMAKQNIQEEKAMETKLQEAQEVLSN